MKFTFPKIMLGTAALGVVSAVILAQIVNAFAFDAKRETASSTGESSASAVVQSAAPQTVQAADPAVTSRPAARTTTSLPPAAASSEQTAEKAAAETPPAPTPTPTPAPAPAAATEASSSSQQTQDPADTNSSSAVTPETSSQTVASSEAPPVASDPADNSATLQTGLFWSGDGLYYADGTGALQKGWFNVDGATYYFGDDGRAADGDVTIGGTSYRFAGCVLQGRLLTVTFNGSLVTDTAQNILSRVVAGEVGLLSHPESYKAQAVAAQSYILFYNARGVAAPAMVDGSPSQAIRDAVAQVVDQVVTYGGAPANTVYGASNCGVTSSAAEVGWSGYPYLAANIESRYDHESPGFETTRVVGRAEMEAALSRIYNSSGSSPLSFEHDPSTWISYDTVDKAGRAVASTMALDIRYQDGAGESRIYRPTANYFKEKSGLGMRSSVFTITYNGDESWTVTTYGYGHGVGMSQEGAYRYALYEGWGYDQILAHYYPGTQIVSYAPPVS